MENSTDHVETTPDSEQPETSFRPPSVKVGECLNCKGELEQRLAVEEPPVYLPKYCSDVCEDVAIARARQRNASFAQAEREHKVLNLLSISNLPQDVARGRLMLDELPRLYTETRVAGGVDTARYAEIVGIVREYVDSPHSGGVLFIYGDRGMGKTWIVQCAVARAIRNHVRSAVYSTTDLIFETVKKAMDADREFTESEAVAMFTAPRLLVLDDIGRGKQLTRWELGIVLRILDERIRHNRPILAASNFDLNALAAVLSAGGEAEAHNAKLLCDRLGDAKKALHIKMAGKSLRKDK